MTDLGNYFHPYLVPVSSMDVYIVNPLVGMINQTPIKTTKYGTRLSTNPL